VRVDDTSGHRWAIPPCLSLTHACVIKIVIGSHGHSGIGNVLLGSVVSRVMALCKTPLMMIR